MSTPTSPVPGWVEAAENVFTKRFDPIDVNVTAIVGADGVLVADTRCSLQEAREIKEELSRITPLPIRWVVNTHAHWDHVWGNAEFAAPRQVPPAELWAHENVPQCFQDEAHIAEFQSRLAAESPEWAAKIAELELRAPDRLVASAQTIDLGGRTVELRHLGRGHTDGDLALWLPDAQLLVAGDMIEQSGPPSYGPDSFPLDWAATLDALLELTGDEAAFVPGHGVPVDAAFVRAQREFVAAVDAQIRELHANGVPAEKALDEGKWPERSGLFDMAVPRGYAQLGGGLP